VYVTSPIPYRNFLYAARRSSGDEAAASQLYDATVARAHVTQSVVRLDILQ